MSSTTIIAVHWTSVSEAPFSGTWDEENDCSTHEWDKAWSLYRRFDEWEQ